MLEKLFKNTTRIYFTYLRLIKIILKTKNTSPCCITNVETLMYVPYNY